MKKKLIKEGKIYVEHAIKTMLKIPDGFVDLVLTSPPYDNLRTYKGFDFPFKDIARGITRILKPGGVLVWVVGDAVINESESGSSFRQALYFKDVCGLNLHDTMIYEKSGSAMPDKTRYLQSFEYMFILSNGRPATVNLIEDRRNRFPERWGGGKKVRGKDGEFSTRENKPAREIGRRFNIWKYSQGGGYNAADDFAHLHPAIFPENLAADHIRSWTNEGAMIYDPFGGSGTTGKICELLRRKWVLSEISEDYANNIAKPRIEATQAKPTLL